MNLKSTLTGGRGFGKSWQRDQWLKDQPLNSKIKMIYATTHYEALPTPQKPKGPLDLTEAQRAICAYLRLHDDPNPRDPRKAIRLRRALGRGSTGTRRRMGKRNRLDAAGRPRFLRILAELSHDTTTQL